MRDECASPKSRIQFPPARIHPPHDHNVSVFDWRRAWKYQVVQVRSLLHSRVKRHRVHSLRWERKRKGACGPKIGHIHLGRRSASTSKSIPEAALPLHMLTGSRSKDSSRTQRRLCFYLQTTCRGLRHATRVDRTASKTRPKIRRSSRVVRVGPFLSRRTAQPAKLTLEPSKRGVYSCTSNGALRLTPLGDPDAEQPRTAVLPMRLCSWRLAPDGTTFSYGGDEVELSVWDIETAFAPKQQPPPSSSSQSQSESSKKRKRRAEPLLPGELWRAKNVRWLAYR